MEPGRGFYQLEESALYVQVGEFSETRRFFSWLESNRVRFDIDRQGRLMLLEIDISRRLWQVEDDLKPPKIAEPADIRWLDFRTRIPDPLPFTNEKRSLLELRFSPAQPWHWYLVTESVMLLIDREQRLASVMITRIEDDLAGRQIARFRQQIGRDAETLGQQPRRTPPFAG